MENQSEKLPRWEKVSQLVSDAIQDEEFRDRLIQANIVEKIEILTDEYGFTGVELAALDEDLKMLANMSPTEAFRWY